MKPGVKTKGKPIRLMELKWTFQADFPEGESEFNQFAIRAFKRAGVLSFAVDLHGPDGRIEGIAQELVDAVKAAFEAVQGKVNAEELDEQTS